MKIELDYMGQFYGALNRVEHPGTFSIGAYLNEQIDPKILQQAVNDIIKWTPQMNVKQRSGFFGYFNETIQIPLVIEKEAKEKCRHFEGNGTLLRVAYGERHFTLEVFHSVCDGRSLALVVNSLLIRYCELMGISVNSDGFINSTFKTEPENYEDAYARYADSKKLKPFTSPADVYIPTHTKGNTQFIAKYFDLSELKTKAKSYGITMSEFLITHIFFALAEQRERDGNDKGISLNVPVDCKSFFPSKTLLNFVLNEKLKMLESNDFSAVAQDIKRQFADITADYVQVEINRIGRGMKPLKLMPLFIKKWGMKYADKVGALRGSSAELSNLGLIKLPEAVQEKVDKYEFFLGASPTMPYQFTCVATGNVLTLALTTVAKDTSIIERIKNALLSGSNKK
jgi:hypothetical protein